MFTHAAQSPSPAATVRFGEGVRQVLAYRTMAFGAALFFASFAPLILLPLGGAGAQLNCYAHWSYGLGEGLALVAVLALGWRTLPLTTAAHAVVSVGWIYLVSKNCALWLALLTNSPEAMAHHAM